MNIHNEIYELGLKVRFLMKKASEAGEVKYLAITPDEQVLALSERFSPEEEKVMIEYLKSWRKN